MTQTVNEGARRSRDLGARYSVTGTVWRLPDAVVYRAVDAVDGAPVLLKVLRPGHGPKEVSRLKREYQFGASLASTAVVKPLGLTTLDGMPALVCEDFGGEPLESSGNTKTGVAPFLELAKGIVSAVSTLHGESVIHKDLKPENIYVHPDSREVKLTGLGLASRAPRELVAVQPPLIIEGSLPYLSPEQTGRVARAIDNRSDLYSLGIIFYRLLTGRLPFEAADALEWIYDHVARQPQSPLDLAPELPSTLGELVLKLLAKMPEDRYQTARGLLFDLERCAAAQRRDGHIQPLVLGERDVAEQPRVPEKVYGRDREIGALLQAFERVVSTGKVELFLVAGHPGVGKSTLVSELRPAALRSRALFLSGKFDQRASSIPYSTLVQAFTRVVLELLGEEEEHARSWSALLGDALGGEAKLMVDVIPPLRLLLGEPPPLVEAPLLDAELRFRRVFLDFLGVFARPERPLVLFLDDLQWADMASLRLLEEIATDPDTHYLLLIGAYRDGEVDAQHPLAKAIERVHKTAIRVSEMVLKPLGTEEMVALVADTLRLERERARPLAELVCDKTGGNPFFVIQFLSSLHQERLLWLDASSLEWRWDVGRIEERRYTDNVIDFMLGRLVGLPAETQGALKIAACIGSECELPILARVYGSSEERTLADLRRALEESLVLQTRGRIVFAHDRVQQAAYALLEPERRAQTHLQIGRVLFESTPPERTQDRLFDIASQFELGVSVVKDEAERLLVAELHLRAGRKAQAASAYELAARYLAVGQSLLPANAWETHYELAYAMHLERARCETLGQRFEETARLIRELLGHAREAVDQLEVAALQIDLAVVQKAIDTNLQIAIAACSRWLGVDLKLHPTESELRRFVEETRRELDGRPIEELARLPETTNAAVKAGIGLLSKTMPAAYYVDLRLHDLMSATIVRLSMEHGNSEMSPHGYSTFGAALGRLFERWDEAYRYGEVAAAVAERRGPTPSPGKVSSYFTTGALLNGWIRPIREVIPLLRRSFTEARACGDINMASFSLLATVEFSLGAGEMLADVTTEAENLLEYTRHVRQYIQDYGEDILRVVRRLRGQPLESLGPKDASGTATANRAEMQHPWFRFQHQACRAIEHFVLGEYESAAAAAESYRTLDQVGSIAPMAHAWYIAALAYSCHFDDAPANKRSELRVWIDDLEGHHRVWEARCAETFRHRRALISAEVARIDGRDAEAMRLYDEAITSSRSGGFVQNEAIAAELAARFCRMRGLSVMAEAYLQRARACYARWGAEAKVDQLDRLHASLRPLEAPGPSATLAVRPEQLDLVSVLKASQTISSEIELDKLVRTLLETVLLQSGAQRAVLVLEKDGRLFVKAQAELEPSGASRTRPEEETLELKEYSALVPVSLLRYVELTREREILSGSAAPGPVEDEYLVRNRPQSALCLPILKQGKVLGLLYLENRITAGAFTAERLAAIDVLATQSAISVENALLLGAERDAREGAQAAERRAAFLSEASARLSESLDYVGQLAWVSRFCVQSLADWCIIDLVKGRNIERAALAHRDPNKELILRELQRRYPPQSDSPQPAANVLRTAAPLLMEDIPEASVRRFCYDDHHARLTVELGARSGVFVPLLARGQVLGALSLLSAKPRHFARADYELAQDLAGRIAVAIDNSGLYRASQEAVQLREEFILVASHELRTPLTSLKLTLAVLKAMLNTESVPAAMRPLLERCLRAETRLDKLVADLLDATRVEHGIQPLERSLVDLGELVREVLSRLQPELDQARCDAVLRIHPRVLGSWDRSRLDQLITNLIVNAAKFGAGRPIEIEVSEQHGRARVSVRDHGIGIPPERQAHIFERFGRAVPAAHYAGLGLGLYLCRRIVEQHGGSIAVKSELGSGAVFIAELPSSLEQDGLANHARSPVPVGTLVLP